jgi:hypothetical protein
MLTYQPVDSKKLGTATNNDAFTYTMWITFPTWSIFPSKSDLALGAGFDDTVTRLSGS